MPNSGGVRAPPAEHFLGRSLLKEVGRNFDFEKFHPTTNAATSCLRHIYIYIFSFFHLTYSRWTPSLPSCLWSQRIFPSLLGSRLTIFLSRCKFSTLTTRQPMVHITDIKTQIFSFFPQQIERSPCPFGQMTRLSRSLDPLERVVTRQLDCIVWSGGK